jgi:hypothetical protein
VAVKSASPQNPAKMAMEEVTLVVRTPSWSRRDQRVGQTAEQQLGVELGRQRQK